jgi:hypothetical protein
MVNTRPSSYAIAKASSKNVDAYICSWDSDIL